MLQKIGLRSSEELRESVPGKRGEWVRVHWVVREEGPASAKSLWWEGAQEVRGTERPEWLELLDQVCGGPSV